ncbi:MAG TPA: hypothetical protein VK059_00510 [Nocardioidaceae bacterium]|nr:hypothetical protein [Nocardioidaceae bacterium]
MDDFFTWACIAGFIALVVVIVRKQNEQANAGADKIICEHCGERGQVTVRVVTRGKGISGGKATAGLMTGGLSLPLAGLSKNQQVRHLTCGNCGMAWDVE